MGSRTSSLGNLGKNEVRPEADIVDSSIEEPVRTMKGLKFLGEALRGESFPMDLEGINYSVGDVEVEDGKGGFTPVRQLTDLLLRTDPSRATSDFDSSDDVIRTVIMLLRQRSG